MTALPVTRTVTPPWDEKMPNQLTVDDVKAAISEALVHAAWRCTECKPELSRVLAALDGMVLVSAATLQPFLEAARHVPADRLDTSLVAYVPGGQHADAFKRMNANLTAGNLRALLAAESSNNG